MVTTTTQYSFQKPTVGDDEDVWGGYLNSNFDSIDSLLRGSTALSTINVTGNITVGGTVDGRDVASDGTKLDGIEAGATADQTKADIDALGIAASTASSLATARNIAVTGAVTGNANFDGSGNISIATTATADPTLTLAGDATGAATFTNLGNATLTVTVADDSHNHVISNVDGLQTALDGKLSTSGKAADSNLLDGIDSGSFLRSDTSDSFTSLTGNSLDVSGELEGEYIGVGNTSGSTGYGLSLYNGGTPGQPEYGINFGQTSSFGTHGQVTGDWATYFTMNNTTGRGWIYRDKTSGVNVASIENTGYATFPRVYTDTVYHTGDTDTYLTFGTNTITLATGGSSEITVNTTGVRLGDTGNGYFQPVSGNYGSIQIDSGAHSGYEGYSIGGRAVFMHDNSSTMGLYDDVNNHWAVRHTFNGTTELYYDGVTKLDTLSNGVSINGNLYTDGSNAEDYDALSGTSPTCNVDNAGAFSLTMTGNTTFTFSGADSNWSMGFILQLTGNGSTVTWPASVDWAGGTAPDAPASGETDIYVFWTRDGGTTWYGVQSIDAAA